jgi:chemotaxis protein CheY-P-specific phosphatase CheC
MKISIEFKNGKYTITYGKMSATAATVKEAMEILVGSFRKELEKFFVVPTEKE